MQPYGPLSQQDSEVEEALASQQLTSSASGHKHPTPSTRRFVRRWTLTELILFSLLIAFSVSWFLHLFLSTSGPRELAYFGAPDKITVPFDHDWEGLEDNAPAGHRYADEKWHDTFPKEGGGSVRVSTAFADKYALPKGAESTQYPGEMHYIIAGYHQLHCLSEIRDQLYEPAAIDALEDGSRRDHVLHCVEAVRQALQCFLDPTLVNLEPAWPHVPNGQLHVCRNRVALGKWAEEHASPLPGSM